jgi:hypothetical protein
MTNQTLIKKLKENEINYYGERPRLWENHGKARIYFGRDYVTIEKNGEIHNRKNNKARALTIGHEITEKINKIANN